MIPNRLAALKIFMIFVSGSTYHVWCLGACVAKCLNGSLIVKAQVATSRALWNFTKVRWQLKVKCPHQSRAWLRGDVVADARCWKKFTLKLNFVFVHTRAKTVSFTAWANTKHRLSIHTGSLFKHLVFRIWKLGERNQKQLFLPWVSFTSANQDPSI